MPVIATCLFPCVPQNDVFSQGGGGGGGGECEIPNGLLTNMFSSIVKEPVNAKKINKTQDVDTWLCSIEPLEPSFQADKSPF